MGLSLALSSFLKSMRWSVVSWILEGDSLWISAVLSLCTFVLFTVLFLEFTLVFPESSDLFLQLGLRVCWILPVFLFPVLQSVKSPKAGESQGSSGLFPDPRDHCPSLCDVQCLENFCFFFCLSLLVSHRRVNLVPDSPSSQSRCLLFILILLYNCIKYLHGSKVKSIKHSTFRESSVLSLSFYSLPFLFL